MPAFLFAQETPAIIIAYENAWLEADSSKRLEKIKIFWAENGEYHDGAAKAKGPKAVNDMIQKFRDGFPNTVFSSNPILSFENYHTWSWRMTNKEKNFVLDGRDFVILDETGKIVKLVGFWGKDKTNENINNTADEETKKKNKIVVAQYFEYLFKTGDFVAMRKIIAKNAVYSQAVGLPYGGTYTGFDELLTMFSKAQPFFDLKIEKEPIYYTNNINNDVMLSFTIKCKAKTSGKDIVMPISEYFELKDGLITAIRPFYFDTKTFSEFIK